MIDSVNQQNYNWALPFGETYVEPITGTRISIGTPDGDSLEVEVEMHEIDNEPPVVTNFRYEEIISDDCDFFNL